MRPIRRARPGCRRSRIRASSSCPHSCADGLADRPKASTCCVTQRSLQRTSATTRDVFSVAVPPATTGQQGPNVGDRAPTLQGEFNIQAPTPGGGPGGGEKESPPLGRASFPMSRGLVKLGQLRHDSWIVAILDSTEVHTCCYTPSLLVSSVPHDRPVSG